MGKKQTGKLMKKTKKLLGHQQLTTNAKHAKNGKSKEARKGPALETVISRQLKAQKKRKRPSLKPQANGNVQIEKEPAFDVETAGAKKGKRGGNKVDGATSLDEFLAGGFEEDATSDEEVSGSEDDLSEDENVNEDEEDSDSENIDNDSKSSDSDQEEDDSADESGTEDNSDDNDETETHKKEIANLKEKDPELYAMLKNESKDLLAFGQSDDEASEDDEKEQEESDQEESDQEEGQSSKPTKTSGNAISMKYLRGLEKEVFEARKVKSIAKWIGLFKSAVQYSIGDTETSSKKGVQHVFENDRTREHVIESTLFKMSEVTLPLTEQLSSGQSSKKMLMHLKRFALTLLGLFKSSLNQDMQIILLQQLREFCKVILMFPGKISKNFFRQITLLWGSTEDAKVRFLAFTRLHQILVGSARASKLDYLKIAYLEFVRAAKFSSARNAEKLAFQASCLVKMFGIDLSCSYEMAFVYIRQLALHLRACIVSKTEDNIASVLSWQFLQCLRLWGSVLCAYPGQPIADTSKTATITVDQQQLRSLVYPLVQVVMGSLKLVPTSKYFPWRLHCVAILVSLNRAWRGFIPVSQFLLDILSSSEVFDSKTSDYTGKPPDLGVVIKVNKTIARSSPYQHELVTRVIELLHDYMDGIRFSIGFPEIAFPVSVSLKRFSKKTHVSKWRNEIRDLLKKIESWSNEIKTKRAKLTFGPASIKRVDQFLADDEAAARAARESERQTNNLPDLDTDVNDIIQNELPSDDEESSQEDMNESESSDEEEGEDSNEEESDASPKKRAKLSSKKKPVSNKRQKKEDDSDSDEDDVLDDMVLSSDESD